MTFQDGRLAFSYNGIVNPLEHWHYDTFSGLRTNDPTFDEMKLTFRTDPLGRVSAVEAIFEPALEEVVFDRKPEALLSDLAYLRSCEGRYNAETQVLTVRLKGSALAMSAPGQPEQDLVPSLGGEFRLKQVRSVSLRFKQDDKGQVTGLDLYQRGGVYEAVKMKD